MSSLYTSRIRLVNPIRFVQILPYHSAKQNSPVKHAEFNSNSAAKTLVPNPNPINLDPATVRQALLTYRNDWHRAFDFFNWVQSEYRLQLPTDTYNLMIDILGKFLKFQLSWDLIQLMRKFPCSFPDHTTFRIMFKHYASAHLVKEAIQTYEKLGQFNLKDETSYCNLIDALCDYNHVHEAQELVFGKNENIKLDGNAKIYTIVLRGWFKLGWWSKCRELWGEMDRRGVQKNLRSFAIYMDILCKSGRPEKAVKLYKQMQSKRMKLDAVAYNIAIRAMGLSQGVDCSIELFREMEYLGLEPTVVTYNTVIKLLCDSNRYEEALVILNTMRKNRCQPNAISYHFFFDCMEKPGKILALFDRMIESGVRPSMDTYVMLMRKFGEWGFLRPVFAVWKKMEELGCRPDASAYDAMIDALVKKGFMDMARKYDQEMLAKGLSSRPRKEVGSGDRNVGDR
ncbi:pentatricopeptide repeat-containing protein At1g80550, mitochondrial-like [Prosopis cineraria]|uniref:pentatricopeptide repeat-containing protein At1g80550, mitochondrial-like n=1 Tax=Prosopis cineraria TaxID=364024 RepID=UPI00241037BA|nr:pentatricopeptide repeat-containing protein At1g80550, mitochondrial-like [Prosopis cineraria]